MSDRPDPAPPAGDGWGRPDGWGGPADGGPAGDGTRPADGAVTPGAAPGAPGAWDAPEAPQEWRRPAAGGWGQPATGGWGDVAGAPHGYGVPPPVPGGGSYGQFGPGGSGYGPMPLGPAPQPGTIPLRPLTVGEIYDGAFRSIRANPTVMFAFSAAVVALLSVLQAVVTWSSYERLNELIGQLEGAGEIQDLDELMQGLQSQLLTSGIGAIVSFIVTTILTGLLIHSVSQSVIGRRMTLGEVWTAARPQLWRLLLLTLVIMVLLVVVIGFFAVVMVLAALSESVGLVLGVGLLAVLGMVLSALFVTVVTVLATPALVLERAGVLTALRRSFRLTMSMFWRVAGIYLLTAILTAILAGIIVYPLQMIGQAIGGFGPATTITAIIGSTIATAVTTPFMAAVIALLYIDIRMRTEGLDAELARAAQEP